MREQMSSEMELISPTTPTALDLLPALEPGLVDGAAANDTNGWLQRERGVNDINMLVSRVTQLVSKHAGTVKFELDLCPSVPDTKPQLDIIAFAVSAILVNQLQTLDDEDDGQRTVRIGTHTAGQSVSISILANGIPQLEAVRAIDEMNAQDCDPIMRHCRQLIENLGGWIDLDEDQNFLGFEVHIPTAPLSNAAGMRPPALDGQHDLEHDICMAC